MKQTRAISFKDQNLYIGLDVHKRSWSVSIRCGGVNVKTFSMEPCPNKLFEHLKSNYPEASYYSVYEAGFCGFWIHRNLINLGITNIVINAADVPTSHKEKVTKTDAVDSRKLARELESGNLNALYVPLKKMEQIRSVCRLQTQLVRESARIKTRIKSHLNYYGAKVPHCITSPKWTNDYYQWLEKLSSGDTAGAYCLKNLLIELKHIDKQRDEMRKELKNFLNNLGYSELLKNLMSIPGIGFKTAATFISEIMDMRRFKRLDELSSFVGLVPSTSSSGERDRTCGLSQRKELLSKVIVN